MEEQNVSKGVLPPIPDKMDTSCNETTDSPQLPLPMQTSSQLFQVGLDIEHGRGGDNSTNGKGQDDLTDEHSKSGYPSSDDNIDTTCEEAADLLSQPPLAVQTSGQLFLVGLNIEPSVSGDDLTGEHGKGGSSDNIHVPCNGATDSLLQSPLAMETSNQLFLVGLDIKPDGGGSDSVGEHNKGDSSSDNIGTSYYKTKDSLQPPLAMKTSSQLFLVGLDIEHGRGEDDSPNKHSGGGNSSDKHGKSADGLSDKKGKSIDDLTDEQDKSVGNLVDKNGSVDDFTDAHGLDDSADEHSIGGGDSTDEHDIDDDSADEHGIVDGSADENGVGGGDSVDEHIIGGEDSDDEHGIDDCDVPLKKLKLDNNIDTSSSGTTDSLLQPPMPLQTSSQFFQVGLDVEHGGDDSTDEHSKGGDDSTDDCDASPAKKLKLDCLDQFDAEHASYFTATKSDENTDEETIFEPYKPSCSQSNLEFDILDEFDSNDVDEDGEVNDISSDSDYYDDIPHDEIDALLDEGLISYKNSLKRDLVSDELAHEEREKVVLKVRGRDHFDVLPEGWIEVTHNSGMPVYLHKNSRVCCMTKPYFLGPGSARKHEIPISAIPCLHYAKELEKEKTEKLKQEKEAKAKEDRLEQSAKTETKEDKPSKIIPSAKDESIVDLKKGGSLDDSSKVIPSAKVECVVDLKKEGSLDHNIVREYCQKLFEFQTIKIKRFKTWSGRRKHMKMQKQRPSLPENTKLITCPLPASWDKGQGSGSNVKREFIMNPVGKSAVCILHEYVQHTLRVQPKYIFKELENASTPYGAVVVINDMQFGFGFGSSKKQAKSEAAKSALDVLIPDMNLEGKNNDKDIQNVEFFDQIRVEDPRVCELCMKAGQPYPYQILLECLKRNYGMGNTDISFEMHNLKHHKNEFKMTVGKHVASVVCKNKRDGKQRASQAILQMLHPQISSWGSLLRMYGIGSRQTMKEKKIEEQRITELQSKACANKPNLSILNKLKEEMLKYRKMKEAMKPIGKLIPEKMELMSTSDSNLKNVDL